jgi:hypothetical protein
MVLRKKLEQSSEMILATGIRGQTRTFNHGCSATMCFERPTRHLIEWGNEVTVKDIFSDCEEQHRLVLHWRLDFGRSKMLEAYC